MTRIILVGVGGFIGSISRYLVSGFVQNGLKNFEFPYGTLVVNILGCFVLGFLAQLADGYGAFSSDVRAFLFVGILGGFTTYSAFGGETFNLLRDQEIILGFLNILGHLLFGLMAVWGGRSLVHLIWRQICS
jgi:CrcB protein